MRVVAFDCTHLPSMVGDMVGSTFCNETGAEKVSVMGVSGATFCVPAAGVVDRRKKGSPLPAAVAPPAPALAPDVLEEPECFGVDPPVVSATTTAITTTAPTTSTQGRRRHGPSAPDSCTLMASARSRLSPHS